MAASDLQGGQARDEHQQVGRALGLSRLGVRSVGFEVAEQPVERRRDRFLVDRKRNVERTGRTRVRELAGGRGALRDESRVRDGRQVRRDREDLDPGYARVEGPWGRVRDRVRVLDVLWRSLPEP
jgi:hypothetical protein